MKGEPLREIFSSMHKNTRMIGDIKNLDWTMHLGESLIGTSIFLQVFDRST